MLEARNVIVQGRVQGVGFRPFIYQQAKKWCLTGTVQNNMDGVKIHIEGKTDDITGFLAELPVNKPRLSRIDDIHVENVVRQNGHSFTIIASERIGTSMLVIPIDSATCDDCLEEMNDPLDFRFQYPFINCTQCGPRYTIINELPYDRPYTSMGSFSFCSKCENEYVDPTNRRHHAQPVACPTCGPQVKLISVNSEEINAKDPLVAASAFLAEGKILAIKGIGGYHLCCDATNAQAVRLLRDRKGRPIRPLAVMSASIGEVKRYSVISPEEETLLKSPEAPIVILLKNKEGILAPEIAPGMGTVGVMLPYTPLHHLLMQQSQLNSLVMTSANPSGLPILYEDREAVHYLYGIADYILTHNRDILHPVDDSVLQISAGKTDFFRRSRGYVPDPFLTTQDVHGIVGFGGQQKTTFSIGRNQQVFIGPHIGDLENMETLEHYKQELDHLLKWISIPYETAVIDLHPYYNVRNLVERYPFKDVVEIQHHHAHMASCIADNELEGKVFAVILDGTGYGLDGNIWGFEVFYGDSGNFERLAHLAYTPLPGGEKCIKEPWRNAVGMMLALHGNKGRELCLERFPGREPEINVLERMVEKQVNTVLAGTCGRLFDAVSALTGICTISTYDGEAAIRLSEYTELQANTYIYPFQIQQSEKLLRFDFSNMLLEICQDINRGRDIKMISTAFHETLVQAITCCLKQLKHRNPNYSNRVVLSGGSFHNRYLKERLLEELAKHDFQGYVHQKVPCNDGGLSYGQLMAAAAKRRAEKCV